MGSEERRRNASVSQASEKSCKTCKKPITNKSQIFNCIACGDVMHMTKTCTGISETAILGISEISQKVLLLCNCCVGNNRKESMINDLMQTRPSIAETKLNEIAEQFSTFKQEIDSLKQKIDETSKKPQNRNEPKQPALNKPESSYNGIRIRGLLELGSKSSRDRHEHDLEEVNKLFAFLTVEAKITDLKRLGKYEEGKRPRTIVVNVSNEWQKRLILMSLAKLNQHQQKNSSFKCHFTNRLRYTMSHRDEPKQLTTYCQNYDKTVFVSKELSPSEFLIENKLLMKRRTMIETGVSAKNLRLRDLVLYQYDEESGNWKKNRRKQLTTYCQVFKNVMPKCQKYFRHQQKNSSFKCHFTNRLRYTMSHRDMAGKGNTR